MGIWRGRLRLFAVLPMAVGLLSPVFERTPDVLVSADARLIGVRVGDDVFMQQIQGGSAFVRDAWLQLWAASAAKPMPLQGEASGGAVACVHDACLLRARPGAKAALLVRGPSKPDRCADTSVIVSAEPARGLCAKPWPRLVDRFTVWREGPAAIWLTPDGAVVLTDRAARGERPWVPPPPVAKAPKAPSLPPAALDLGASVLAQ